MSKRILTIVLALLTVSCSPLTDLERVDFNTEREQLDRRRGGCRVPAVWNDNSRRCLSPDMVIITYASPDRRSLPEICREFYNDGTGRWRDCMGVGYK